VRAAPARRRQSAKKARLQFGPLLGLRDSYDPLVSKDPLRATVIENLYPIELDKPSSFEGRPGFDQAGSQLGATNKRTGQLICQFTKQDGTEYTVAIVGGQGIYTYNWSTEAWSQVVTVANLTTASVTLSETARCYAVAFADTLVISDGTNTPFTWTGASGAGGLTSLTNCPVLYGQPVVYYNKLFGIKNTERNVIVWSEENDPATGYEAGGYSNAWQLIQSAVGALYRLEATNEALYFFRAGSVGAIRGAVTPEFQSDGTREGVDETVGTVSPSGVVSRDGRIFFVDRQARPHVIEPGRVGAVPAWEDIHETLRSISTTAANLAEAEAIYDPTTQLVLFGLTELGQSDPSGLLVFNPVLNIPVAIWRWTGGFSRIAAVKNGDGVPTLMHLSTDGYAYDHGLPTSSLWSDELNAGTAAIRHSIEGPHLGVDARYEKRFHRIDVLLRADADTTEINCSYNTPYGASTAQSGSVEGAGARWDLFNWDAEPWATDTIERHLPFGISALGRWIRPRIQHEVAGERFGFEALVIDYTEAGDHPLAP
jgi:hypothetical protein